MPSKGREGWKGSCLIRWGWAVAEYGWIRGESQEGQGRGNCNLGHLGGTERFFIEHDEPSQAEGFFTFRLQAEMLSDTSSGMPPLPPILSNMT
jgi:hypothetical protein